ncbi:VOC family protein [Rhodococcus sp. NPDC060086]|uniref:VOC family protein n=1 Tax=unclassified Rhodococcus (in: high G+C Gram-positive bacteria) TaxID=192944 RepID=UPI0036576E6F
MTSTAANQDRSTTDNRAPNVWPCLAYTDARGAISFLVDTLGFTESACYGEGDRIDHAELTWPYGGGIMLGSAGRDTPLDQHADSGTVYLVVPEDALADDLYEKVRASAATVTVEMRDEDYGSHGFTCRDPQGVFWSIGTYAGHGFGQ